MVKKLTILLAILVASVACGGESSSGSGQTLLVTDGSAERRYSVEELEKLASAEAQFAGVTYVGVPLTLLLSDAGLDPSGAAAVKATASDGFTANYGPNLIARPDTLVAYAQTDGPLSDDDGAFRMVLPDQEGKMNPRHLVELRIIP